MTMVATPRRNLEVLTRRTAGASRRDEAQDIESDACFDRDDEQSGSKASPQYQQGGSSAGSTTRNSNINSQRLTMQQKRNKRRRAGAKSLDYAKVGIACMICLLVLLSISLFLASKPMTGHENRKRQKFEQFSLDAPTSCNQPLEEDGIEFTLVTQVSSDRLWMMEHHCDRWKLDNQSFYPISIAVLTNETDAQVEQTLRDFGCDMDLLTVQVVPAHLYPPDDYPVNILRNIALKGVQTSHVMYVDIDFWISTEMSSILQYPEVLELLASDSKAALVIPAFQLHRQCHQWRECPEDNIPQMPRDLLELKSQIINKKVTRFDPTNRGGHGSTKYKEWFGQNREDGDVLLEIDCFLSNRYEPYLVFRYCQELPPFQEPFSGYGKNKMTWVMQLRRMGYTFWQLGKGAFVIHYPHLDSPSRVAWNNAPNKRKDPSVHWADYKRGQMDQLFVEFREWLRVQVPDMTQVPFCHDKLDDDARLLYDRKAFNRTKKTHQAST